MKCACLATLPATRLPTHWVRAECSQYVLPQYNIACDAAVSRMCVKKQVRYFMSIRYTGALPNTFNTSVPYSHLNAPGALSCAQRTGLQPAASATPQVQQQPPLHVYLNMSQHPAASFIHHSAGRHRLHRLPAALLTSCT